MKRVDLERKLRADGWVITSGGNHDIANHPKKPGKIPIPRHREINEYTAKGILIAAGLS